MDECSKIHQRTIGAIKIRIEYIIYKIIINENQDINDIDHLKKYIDISIEDVIKKHKIRSKDKIDEKILNELKDINSNIRNLSNVINNLDDTIKGLKNVIEDDFKK